jgi:hypothetical protein
VNRHGRENLLFRALNLTTPLGNLGCASCGRSISPLQIHASQELQTMLLADASLKARQYAR